ncbi:hypothetical protein PSEUDO8O_150425 [Pseudomonas sp. 8O]|nr:hypothetical protein PSEUDO8O_150425 [Pseudomonas sp. 8O]
MLYQLSYTGIVGAPLYPFVSLSKATFEPGFSGLGYQQLSAYAQREGVSDSRAPALCAGSRFFASHCFCYSFECCTKNDQMSTRQFPSGFAAFAQKGSTELSTASVRNSGALGQQ